MAAFDETGTFEGVETWERLQSRQLQLALRKELKRVEGDTAEAEEWEVDLAEPWHDDNSDYYMKRRLEVQLRSNSLDYEKKPFSQLTNKNVDLGSGKTTSGVPMNIIWKEGPAGGEDDEAVKQNSDHLMAALKLWGMELPQMTLVVQAGSSHPWQLIRIQQMADQREDFLKSRPQFNDSYLPFKGQRDPTKGWMAAGNAWRYPAFYISPKYNPTEFTFRPPHTLFVDAALQVQEDHELIETGDRTANEWIMDAVTHQPIGRQAAIKGADGVFYWDLDAPALSSAGVISIDADLRNSYKEWAEAQELQGHQVAMEGGYSMTKAKYLVASTRQACIDRWGLVAARMLLHHRQQIKKKADNQLSEGEIRVEINSLKFNRTGLDKLAHLMPPADLGSFSGALDSMSGGTIGAMTKSAMQGDIMVLVKLMIPGDQTIVTDPLRVSRGPQLKTVRIGLSQRSYHVAGTNDPEMQQRSVALQQAMRSKNPADSLLKISVVLADSAGREVTDDSGREIEIGTFEQSLKEMVQDTPSDDVNNTHELPGDIEIFGIPPPDEKALLKAGGSALKAGSSALLKAGSGSSKKDKSPASPATPSRKGFGLSRGSTMRIAGAPAAADTQPPPPPPVQLGVFKGRIAIRPPSVSAKDMKDDEKRETRRAKQAVAAFEMAALKRNKVAPEPVFPSLVDSLKGRAPESAASEEPPAEEQGAGSAPAFEDGYGVFGYDRPIPPPVPDFRPPVRSTASLEDIDDDPFSPRNIPPRPAPRSLAPLPSSSNARSPSLFGQSPPTAMRDLETTLAAADQVTPAGQDLMLVPADNAPSLYRSPPPSPPSSPEMGEEEVEADEEGDEEEKKTLSLMALVLQSTANQNKQAHQSHTIVYTVAYWIMWRTVESISDQRLLFGDNMNQPILIRGNKLGALVNNYFCATDYDPRWNGDNWQLVVATNDGAYSKFYVGFSSDDESGIPEPAKAEEPTPGRPPCDVKTMVGGHVSIKRLNTTGKGAGLLAQAWIWPRDLSADEVRELWMMTKSRYPVAKRGVSSLSALPFAIPGGLYRTAPNPIADDAKSKKKKRQDDEEEEHGKLVTAPPPPPKPPPPKPLRTTSTVAAKVIEKDMSAMLDVPLVNKLAFQRLLNVFSVLVDYANVSNSFIAIDRIQNFSCTAELMLELALRKNPTTAPTVLVFDSKLRLEKANHKLKELKLARFLRKNCQVSSTGFLNASLRELVTPQGLTWLRATSKDLVTVTHELLNRKDESRQLDAQHVRDIYELYGDEGELRRDGRPNHENIWKTFYAASLFASGTHYMIFDHVEMKGRSVLGTLGTVGSIFLSGGTAEHAKIVEQIQAGSPLLLLESTGGVTQAFAHTMKAVRLMKARWPVDYVLRLVTEYKSRAANKSRDDRSKADKKIKLEEGGQNIDLLDKELARIDLLLSSEEKAEVWMRSFGLPEILMLFEAWQRAPEFLMRQIQMADVMKKSAEDMLQMFTGCFSSPSGVPELGLGNAEKKVVYTAWNRHLLLFHNGDKYNARSWIIQLILYIMAIATTALAILTTMVDDLVTRYEIRFLLLVLPISMALLATVSTRLRQKQKFSMCKMASFTIVSEIYKFRVRAMEYDQQALSAAVAAMNATPDEKKDEDAMPKPISSKERDKIARKMFVERVKNVYTQCMATELATGTSISHTTQFGLDPARLLRDYDAGGADEDEVITRKMLQKHVAEKLYYIKNIEWERGAEGFKKLKARNSRNARKQREAGIKRRATMVYHAVAGAFVGIAVSVERQMLLQKARAQHLRDMVRGEATEEDKEDYVKKYAPELPESNAAASSKAASKDEGPTRLQKLRMYYRGKTANAPPEVVIGDGNEKIERLEEAYRVPDDDEEGEDDGGGAAAGRPDDDLLGPLTIEDYMKYRARPVCTYLERTAPWRAFELQMLEIFIFCFNSLGAILVGLGYEPYVSLTVAVAAVLKSFMDFANLSKQVEAYNAALRDIHSMMNDWDGKTSTERRTQKVVTYVVGTVETSLLNVAIALCDAQPTAASGEGGDEEGGDEEKKEKDK